jgi:hypothetical protein
VTTWDLIWACAAGALVLLGGLAWMATWPVARTKGRHRLGGPENPAYPANPAPADDGEATQVIRLPHPRHRHEHIGEATTALRWYERPSGPQPIYPKPDQIE